MSFHLLACLWFVLGLPKVGDWAAGVFRMIGWFSLGTSKGTALGFLAIANIAIWASVRVACWRARMRHAAFTVLTRTAATAVRAAQPGRHPDGWLEVPRRRRIR